MSDNTNGAPSTTVSTPGRDMTSKIFELITGDDTIFYVHSDVLTSQSTPFHRAVTGPWNEATERRILLADWDTTTVSRLVEFLYTGDYAYPDPIRLAAAPAPGAANPPTPDDPIPRPVDEQLERNRPLTPFNSCLLGHLLPNRPDKVSDVQRLGPFDPLEFDYAAILLVHARVYVLANYKGVEYLQTLALKRVHLVLSRLQPLQTASRSAGNVTEFAEYVYANTSQLSRSEEPLRKITSHFIALNLVAFQNESRAVTLMEKGGDLVTDVMAKLCRRMLDPEDDCSGDSPLRKRYTSRIYVVWGVWGAVLGKDHSMIKDINGDSVIKAEGQPRIYFYLASEYTDTANDACTRFVTTISPSVGIIKEHGVEKILKIEGIKDVNECAKVTDACLIRRRSDGDLDFEATKEYDGMSDNISYDSNGVYLLWKTVRTK